MLDNTQLGPSQVQVSSAANLDDIASSASAKQEAGTHDADDIPQDEKPRSRIVAEYLAHGYALSDNALQKAIALDNKHGISARFTTALSQFDAKYKATDKAKGIDASYGLTDKATTGWKGLNSYFEKAIGTPTGQKLAAFYTQSDKQVRDIHAEARRLADLKGGKTDSNQPTPVAGTDKTTCQCGGADGSCPCAEGKCACSGCGKSSMQGEGKTATGPADTVAASTGVAPLGEKV